jgi:hypothetical protein
MKYGAAMKNTLKLLHIVAAIGFVGTLAVSLLLAAGADTATASAFAASRRAILLAADNIALPSLVLLLLTGMLMLVKQPALIDARWVWGKAVIGLLVAGIALLAVQPAVNRAAQLSQLAAESVPAPAPLAAALRAERIGASINLALSLAAVALAVWRPQFGKRPGS